MYVLEHKFWISAAHYLPKMPPQHPCHEAHGHNWEITVKVSSPVLDSCDFVMDFSALKAICQLHVRDRFDHKFLNKVGIENPTCENMAKLIAEIIEKYLCLPQHVLTIGVMETQGNMCWYIPE